MMKHILTICAAALLVACGGQKDDLGLTREERRLLVDEFENDLRKVQARENATADELARTLRVELQADCDSVIGIDGNLVICENDGGHNRIYRILGPGKIRRVLPGKE